MLFNRSKLRIRYKGGVVDKCPIVLLFNKKKYAYIRQMECLSSYVKLVSFNIIGWSIRASRGRNLYSQSKNTTNIVLLKGIGCQLFIITLLMILKVSHYVLDEAFSLYTVLITIQGNTIWNTLFIRLIHAIILFSFEGHFHTVL